MKDAFQSSKSDNSKILSLEGDNQLSIPSSLRRARLSLGLTQAELAHRLGLRQRQISDLETGAVDPRVSTVQNVARALDLEPMLIPRRLIATIEGLHRVERGESSSRPAYSLDNDLSDQSESSE